MYAVVSYRADGDIESPNLYGTPKIETEPVETEDEATLDLFEEMTRIKDQAQRSSIMDPLLFRLTGQIGLKESTWLKLFNLTFITFKY